MKSTEKTQKIHKQSDNHSMNILPDLNVHIYDVMLSNDNFSYQFLVNLDCLSRIDQVLIWEQNNIARLTLPQIRRYHLQISLLVLSEFR